MRKIESQKVQVQFKGQDVSRLEPNLEHLTALMSSIVDATTGAGASGLRPQEGPGHVRAHYTWDHVAALLRQKIFD